MATTPSCDFFNVPRPVTDGRIPTPTSWTVTPKYEYKPITITSEDLAWNKPVYDGARFITHARLYNGPIYDGARFAGYYNFP